MNVFVLLTEFILEYLLIAQLTIEQHHFVKPPEEWGKGTKGDVIIVPGFNETWIFQKTLANFLNKNGYRIHTIPTIDHNTHTITHCVREIESYIRIKKLNKVILLAHSKGGLIVENVINTSPIHKNIEKAFTLSVPYKGTIWGYAGFQNLNELSFHSKKLAKKSSRNKKIINMYSIIDQHVIPNRNLLLDGATNIQVKTYWHTRILESIYPQEVIKRYIK